MTKVLLDHQWLAGCEYINPDDIAQTRFGDWNDPDAVLKAAQEATRQRHECLRQRSSFAFETVFSTTEKMEFLRKAKDAGFFVRMFFVGTDDPEINCARVARRVKQGGHSVPIKKIIDRFGKSLANLPRAIAVCDRVYVYDNSMDRQDPAIQFRTVNGVVKNTYGTGRAWANVVRECVDNTPTNRPQP